MNREEYIKYVDEICNNIKNKLDEESEEFDFFLVLVNTFNEVCNERQKLENVLDEIKRCIKNNIKECVGALSNPEYALISKHELLQNEKQRNKNLLEIIKKARGE